MSTQESPKQTPGAQASLAVSPTFTWEHQEGGEVRSSSLSNCKQDFLEAAATEDKVPLLRDLPFINQNYGCSVSYVPWPFSSPPLYHNGARLLLKFASLAFQVANLVVSKVCTK